MNGENGHAAGVWEKLFVVVSLLFFLDAFLPLYLDRAGLGGNAGEGNRLVLAVSFFIYSVTLLLARPGLKAIFSLWRSEWLLASFLAFALLSAFWSDVPEITLRRTVSLLGTSFFASYFATRFSAREQLALLAAACGICVVFSGIFGWLIPSIGEVAGRGLRGVFYKKNVLGRAMALSVLIFLLLQPHRGWGSLLKWGLTPLAVVLLLLSGSKGSLLVCMAVTLLIPLYASFRCRFDLNIFTACCYLAAGSLLILGLSGEVKTMLDLFGRDVTFTGRTHLWEAVLEMIRKRPLLGYGYNGFWLGERGESAVLWRMVGWRTPHAHNGLLDLWLNLGSLGVALFLAGFLRALQGAIRYLKTREGRLALWPLLYLSFLFLANITESALARHNSIFWVLYVATVCSCGIPNERRVPESPVPVEGGTPCA